LKYQTLPSTTKVPFVVLYHISSEQAAFLMQILSVRSTQNKTANS